MGKATEKVTLAALFLPYVFLGKLGDIVEVFSRPDADRPRATDTVLHHRSDVARDVCDILEIQNVSQAIHGLDNDEKADICITYTSSSGTKQSRNVITVNESGLYALIFKSRKEEAKAFRKWVTSEVLPSIRKTGKYDTRDIRQKSVDARNAFTAGCKRQGLTERRGYREATIATYESLFGDTEIRKAGMNRNQVLKLMALESVETYKYDCLPKDTLMLPGIKRPVKETAHLLETATGRSAAHIGTLA